MIEMTATVLLKYKEIIVALIAVFGVVVPYLLQKNKELNLKIDEQKREAYTSFLKNFTETALAVMHDEVVSGKDADRERMSARDQLLLYASDDVIKSKVPLPRRRRCTTLLPYSCKGQQNIATTFYARKGSNRRLRFKFS